MVITTRGKMVFVSESFPLPLARKLTALILDAQGTGEMKMARAGAVDLDAEARQPLTGNLVHLLADCGVMKAAVKAAARAGR